MNGKEKTSTQFPFVMPTAFCFLRRMVTLQLPDCFHFVLFFGGQGLGLDVILSIVCVAMVPLFRMHYFALL